jgi:photosystem II stability/assembly factor-like uncharacterized protein
VGRYSTILKTTKQEIIGYFYKLLIQAAPEFTNSHVFNKVLLCAGHWGKIYKTTNGGINWQYVVSEYIVI